MNEQGNERNELKHVVVIGLGYVGLPLALAACDAGHRVTGIDTDADRIEALRNHSTYIDDITSASIAAATRLTVSTDASGNGPADVVIITVPTPLVDGVPDLSAVEAASRSAGSLIVSGSLVVLESTSYPGTTEDLMVPILEAESGLVAGSDFDVGFSPERIDPGRLDWTLVTTPKLVAGIDERSLDAVDDFYSTIVDVTVRMAGTREAEMAKLLENTFRHVNIALVNELAISARALGIDVADMLDGAATKPFGFMSFRPGPGVGGHCLPVDPTYLSWQFERMLGAPTRFIEVANDINRSMPEHVVKRVQLGLNDRSMAVRGSSILVLGMAYKKNTADCRQTPALEIIERLVGLGAAVSVHDNHVDPEAVPDGVDRLDRIDTPSVGSFDAVVLVTDHDDVDYDLVASAAQWVFDSRHRMTGRNVEPLWARTSPVWQAPDPTS